MSSIIKSPYITISQNNKRVIKYEPNYSESQHDAYLDHDVVEQLKNTASLELAAARTDANKIISQAKVEAEIILSDAVSEAEVIKNKAFEAAKDEGYQIGLSEGMNEADKIKDQAKEILVQAEVTKNQMLQAIEPKMAELIGKILHHVSGLLIDKDDLILHLIKKGFMEIEVLKNIVIHVSKEDFDYVNNNKTILSDELGETTEFELLKDHNLSKGDCIIETEVGNIDSSLGTQLELLIKDLKIISNKI